MSRRFRLDIAYDGTAFAGWQVQPGRRTVQGELSRTLGRLGESAQPMGAGRTDAGVHALTQSAHVDLERAWELPFLAQVLQDGLPPDIRLLAVRPAPPNFHARHRARSRTYLYALGLNDNPFFRFRRWVPGILPPERWASRELESLLGERDFTAWARSGGSAGSSRCRLHAARWRPYGGGAVLLVASDRFLHGMVRALVGGLIRGYQAGASSGHLRRLLEGDRNAARRSQAPPDGLYLAAVGYPGDPEVVDKSDMLAAIAGLGGREVGG